MWLQWGGLNDTPHTYLAARTCYPAWVGLYLDRRSGRGLGDRRGDRLYAVIQLRGPEREKLGVANHTGLMQGVRSKPLPVRNPLRRSGLGSIVLGIRGNSTNGSITQEPVTL